MVLVPYALGWLASILGGLVIVPGCWVPSALGRVASALGNSSSKKDIHLLGVPVPLMVRPPSLHSQQLQLVGEKITLDKLRDAQIHSPNPRIRSLQYQFCSHNTSKLVEKVGFCIRPLNTHHNTWLRLYKPTTTSPHKLPLILYFHGGGFILYSATDSIYHDFCGRLAAELPAVVISVEYRLASENHLPTAYENVEEAIKWVREQAIMNEENKGEGVKRTG
ncbi:hypothetical protein Sjap_016090 [Stephania japonica]|uniref:Alpha/beta hydrolase fold-3 domain-containing protein n=1 Tax=Stephania japonica TaxID=461633 RepID=A0AAP0NS07_9MAGN